MNYSRFACLKPTHEAATLQYICTHPKCLKNNSFIACINCGKDEHREHLESMLAIKVFINSVVNGKKTQVEGSLNILKEKRKEVKEILRGIEQEIAKIEKKNSNWQQDGRLKETLLNNLSICKSEEAFRQNLFELVEASCINPDEKLLNDEMVRLRKFADNFEINKESAVQPIQKDKAESKLHHQDQQLIRPIFTFKQMEHSKLISPYSVKCNRTGFTSVLAYPSLNTFRQSVQFSFIIKRVTPDWLGVGITRNKGNFSLTEKGFFLWVSNGWMFLNGKQQQSNVRFAVNDKITVRFDKAKNLIIMFKNGKVHEPKLCEIQDELWSELYPCIVFYNKGDVVDILQ